MAKIIAISKCIIDTGKLTIVQNIAAVLKQQGYKVLVIDLDPDETLTGNVNAQKNDVLNIIDVIERKAVITEAIQILPEFDIVPVDGRLPDIEQTEDEYRLKDAIEAVAGWYDYIIINMADATKLIMNALNAAEMVIIETSTGYSVKYNRHNDLIDDYDGFVDLILNTTGKHDKKSA